MTRKLFFGRKLYLRCTKSLLYVYIFTWSTPSILSPESKFSRFGTFSSRSSEVKAGKLGSWDSWAWCTRSSPSLSSQLSFLLSSSIFFRSSTLMWLMSFFDFSKISWKLASFEIAYQMTNFHFLLSSVTWGLCCLRSCWRCEMRISSLYWAHLISCPLHLQDGTWILPAVFSAGCENSPSHLQVCDGMNLCSS